MNLAKSTATKRKTAGLALLYAVVLASIVLTIGLSLSSVIFRQLVISSIGRESRVAYYAANAGRECARLWTGLAALGLVSDPFGTVSPAPGGRFDLVPPKRDSITCANAAISPLSQSIVPNETVQTEFELTFNDNSCSRVTVWRSVNANLEGFHALITSAGYNTCESAPRRVERIVRVQEL